MVSARLNTLDQLYLHLDRPEEPWSVHVEIRVEGRLDGSRLIEAARRAAARHPIARARLGPGCRWEIADALDEVALVQVDGDALAGARERLLGHTPRLDRPGPFELLLAHDTAGDVVVLNLHHAAGDGVSALRLMTSIARAYGEEDDPLPPVDPLSVRDTVTGVPAVGRGRGAADYVSRGAGPPSRIAPTGGDGAGGYGFELMRFDPTETQRIARRRSDDATLDDVLLGALAVTVRRWNDRHDGDHRPVYITMPINLRPAEWRGDVVGNFAPYVSVCLDPGTGEALPTTVAGAAESTRGIKDGAAAGLIAELFAPPTVAPAALKERLQNLILLTGNLLADTAVLSNLGCVGEGMRLGDAGPVRELWFSPPARMPLGGSFGAVSLEERLFLTLRYRHALFDASAAREFAALYRHVLLTG